LGPIQGPQSLRSGQVSLISGPPFIRHEPLLGEHPLAVLNDQGRGEGHDDDDEHQRADAKSPAGTMVFHDRRLSALHLVVSSPVHARQVPASSRARRSGSTIQP
jgi:hypothetical protein